MKMKRMLGILLVLVLVISSMTTMAFAAQVYPNFEGDVSAGKYDCVHKTDAEVSVVISKKGMEDIVISLPYNEYYDSYYAEDVVDGVDKIVKVMAPFYDIVGKYVDALKIMKGLGYSVSVVIEDYDEEHQYNMEDMSLYVDFETPVTLYKEYKELIAEKSEEIKQVYPDYEYDGSFDNFVAKYKEMLMHPDGWDQDEESAEEMLAYDLEDLFIVKAKLDAAKAGDYPGQMQVGVYVTCECPDLIEYSLYHEYYDENGEYVAQESEWPRVLPNTVISVDELEFVTEYDGVEYQVEGVYLYDSEKGEVDWDNPIDKFTVVDYYDEETEVYYHTDVVIKYVPVSDETGDGTGQGTGGEGTPEGGEGTPEGGEGTTGDNNNQDSVNKDDSGSKDDSKTPSTGDMLTVVPYVLLMAAAVVCLKKVRE